MLLLDAEALKKPDLQALHVGGLVVDVAIEWPAGHLISPWAVQESVFVEFQCDREALKNPAVQSLHVGLVVAEPAVLVYWPGGHRL